MIVGSALWIALLAAPSAVCAPCHAARVKEQALSPHALALRPWTGEHFAGRTLRERGSGGGRTFAFDAAGVRIASEAEGALAAPIAWAFGSGQQAITPVLERDGRFVEHRLSWFRRGDKLGLTPGHVPAPPLDLEESLGVVESETNAQRCFGCHTTGGEPGVTCQACHGAGEEHRRAPAKGTIARDRSMALCSRCHRSPRGGEFTSATPEIEDPLSVRFAPIGLAASRCFQASRTAGKLTCVTCHDPHTLKPARPLAEACQECHHAAPIARRRQGGRAACPRTPDCASCHMPVSSPAANLRFTDHRIR